MSDTSTINNLTSIHAKPNLIFLDIDGPIINTPCYYIDPECSVKRTVMNTQAIGYVKELVRRGNALVVLNTTHNTHLIEDPLTAKMINVKQDLIKWGMKEEEFHPEWKTEYPNPKNCKLSENRRSRAVKNWLEKNGDHEWIAFDDEFFHYDFQYHIDFDKGIDYDAFLWGKKMLGIDDE